MQCLSLKIYSKPQYIFYQINFRCVEVQRCPDGRNLGLEIVPKGTPKFLTDLIHKAQNAKCPEDGNVCCGDKYIISEDPTLQHINEIADVIFKEPETDFEHDNSAGLCNISLLTMLVSLFYAYIF